MSEVYYVLGGEGTVTLEAEKAAIHTGDAVPAGLGETKSFTNTGIAPLEFMIFGIARDMAAKEAFMTSPLGMTGSRAARQRNEFNESRSIRNA